MITFEKAVRFITATRHEKDGKVIFVEQRLTRAKKDYARWMEAVFPKDRCGAAAAIGTVKEKGFDKFQILVFRDAFRNWKKQHKSLKAKQNRSLRGRVKRKDDKPRGPHPNKKDKAVIGEVYRDKNKRNINVSDEQAKQLFRPKRK